MKTTYFIAALLFPLILLFLVFYFLFPEISQQAPSFSDIIIESVAWSGLNKEGELLLFKILAAAGIVLVCLLVVLFSMHHEKLLRRAQSPDGVSGSSEEQSHSRILSPGMAYPGILCFLLIPALIRYIVYQELPVILLLGLLYGCFVWFFCRKTGLSESVCLLLPLHLYYALLALLTAGVRISDRFAISTNTIYALTAGMTLLFLLVCLAASRSAQKLLVRLLLILQLCIPFLLTLYFTDSYLYKGELLHIRYASFYYVFFGGLLLLFVVLAVRHLHTNWNKAQTLSCSRLISVVTVITIFIYNSYSVTCMYAQPDQHHHGEQMIPWQQIFGLGQQAYTEYTPVSGLFPLVIGFIQNVLLGGTVSDYPAAVSIMMVLFCIVTAWLLYRHVGGAYSLLFVVFFALPSYNRQYMVLPVLLLLFLPALLKKPGLWLKVWILSCFLAGLYYPLFGAALLIGTLPIGIRMLLSYIRSTDFSKVLRKPSFYAGWLVCLLPVLVSLPLLWRMLKHTLLYSSQTVLADGIALYGQSAPDYFMPFLAGTHENIRSLAYLGIRFFLPMAGLWIPAALITVVLVSLWKRRAGERTQTGISEQAQTDAGEAARFSAAGDCSTDTWSTISADSLLVYGLLAALLVLSVSYSYTLVRADTGVILSRTAKILVDVLGIFIPVLLLHFGKQSIPRHIRAFLIGFCLSLPLLLYHRTSDMRTPQMWVYPDGESGILMDDADKLFSCFTVPDTFIRMNEIDISDTSMLGEGFMVADQVSYLENYDKVIQKCSAVSDDVCYMNFDGQGFYYYLNAKACATGYTPVARSYEAQQEIISVANEKRPVIFTMDASATYYIYCWMWDSNYVYSAEDQAFYPSELYQKIYPDRAASGDDYRLECPSTDLSRTCASLGASMDTLSSLFVRQASAKSLLSAASEDVMTSDMSGMSDTLDISAASDTAATICGSDYDFLYLQFDTEEIPGAETLQITFRSDGTDFPGASVSCQIENGTLLIPLGMNADWLLSENSDLCLTFLGADGSKLLSTPLEDAAGTLLKTCEFLKLRQ